MLTELHFPIWPLTKAPCEEGKVSLVGLGVSHSASDPATRIKTGGHRSDGSDETIKGPVHRVSNLDGSSYQPRRSHAIAIKSPKDGSIKLNPNTPSYFPPGGAPVSPETEEFVPSPNMIAQVSELVNSPKEQERILHDSISSQNQISDSSVSTTNFFAEEAHKYSTKKYKYDGQTSQVNLATWLADNSAHPIPEVTTPTARVPNKFMFSDSPADRDASPEAGQLLKKPASESEQKYFSHQREATVTADETHRLGTNVDPKNLEQSQDYLAGFMQGLRQDLMMANANEEFRQGYRDGLIQSSKMVSTAPLPQTTFGGCTQQREFGAESLGSMLHDLLQKPQAFRP